MCHKVCIRSVSAGVLGGASEDVSVHVSEDMLICDSMLHRYLDIRDLFIDDLVVTSHLHVFGVRVKAYFMHTFHGQSSVHHTYREGMRGWDSGDVKKWLEDM